MRPKQWIKNFFIFAGLIFARHLFDLHLFLKVMVGFTFFCLATSSIYIFNDIRDIEKDKEHPEKRKRPLAAGQLSVNKAYIASGVFATLAFFGALQLDRNFFIFLVAYIVMNIAYSIKIKQLVILDVMCIAFGFVLRVFAGTALAGVRASDWLILCTITLSLFLGFTKRRQELLLIGHKANNHRAVLIDYSITFLDQMIAVATACAIISYALYTIADETVSRFGTRNLVYTIPFVIYGFYRYLYLIHQKKIGENPTSVIWTDLPLLLNSLLWIGSVVIIIY
jgi:4-hydroxybenzoate polyprenyltransferase